MANGTNSYFEEQLRQLQEGRSYTQQTGINSPNQLLGEETDAPTLESSQAERNIRNQLGQSWSVTDLENNTGYMNVAERFLRNVGWEGDDIFESLRDLDWNLGQAAWAAYRSRGWSDQTARDYQLLRSIWDDTNIEGFSEWFDSVKDVGQDIIFDPTTWMGGFLVGGAVKAGAKKAFLGTQLTRRTLTGRQVGTPLFQQGATPTSVGLNGRVLRERMQQAAQANAVRVGMRNNIALGLGAGAFEGGAFDLATQITEKNAGIRAGIDGARLLGKTIAGAGLGSAFALAGNQFIKRANRRYDDEVSRNIFRPEEVIDEAKRIAASNKDEEFSKLAHGVRKYMVLGKPLRNILEYHKKSPMLKELFGLFRQDYVSPFKKNIAEARGLPYYAQYNYDVANLQQDLNFAFTNYKNKSKGSIFSKSFGHSLTLEEDMNLGNLISLGSKYFDAIKRIGGYQNGKFTRDLSEADFDLLLDEFSLDDIDNLGLDLNFKYTKDFLDLANSSRKVIDTLTKRGSKINLKGTKNRMGFLLDPRLLGRLENQGYFPRYLVSKDILRANRAELEKLLIRYGHADPIDDINESVNAFLIQDGRDPINIRDLPQDYPITLGDQTFTLGDIKSSEVARSMDDRLYEKYLIKDQTQYKSFRELAKANLGADASEEAITAEARKLKASAIVDEMIASDPKLPTKDNARHYADSQFIQQRRFINIPDSDLRRAGVIQVRDVQAQLNQYINGMSRNILNEQYFGRTLTDFERRWLEPVKKELRDSGVSEDEIANIEEVLKENYRYTTNQADRGNLSRAGRIGLEMTQAIQVLAHLGLTTISSITEPVALMMRTDSADIPEGLRLVKGIMTAQIKRIGHNIGALSDKSLGKGGAFKTFPQALKEEESIQDLMEGFAFMDNSYTRLLGMGDDDSWTTPFIKKGVTGFFKVNLLTEWTQFVRAASYGLAKSRSTRYFNELYTGVNSFGKKLDKADIEYRVDALHEIGVNVKRGLSAFRKSLNEAGELDESEWQNTSFYQDELNPSSGLLANQIVLDANAAENSKPLFLSKPAWQVIFQFASYPTAFSNVVMKNYLRDVVKFTGRNSPKAFAAINLSIMLGALANFIRPGGLQYLDEYSDDELFIAGASRSGVNTKFIDLLQSTYRAREFSPNELVALARGTTGPVVGDAINIVNGYKSPSELLVDNFPIIGSFPAEQRQKFHEAIFPQERRYEPVQKRAKGGLVTNVPNVSEEPDEMKVRGLPYTYQELAGGVMKEPEDRLGFQEGGMVQQDKDDFMEVYSYLTQQEKYYESYDEDNLELYNKKEISKPSVNKELYMSLPENSYQALFYECREGQEVGLPVYDSQMKTDKPFKFKGYVKFNNPLEINIDNTSPEDIARELETIELENSLVSKQLTSDLVKDIKFQLSMRDDALARDPRKSRAKEERMRESKCFVIRDRLLRMGFDAIKFNGGYSLLQTNQFYPTEELKIGFKKGGLVDRMRKRKGYAEGGKAKTQLYKDIMNYVTRATGKEEKEFFKTHPYYGELKDNKAYVNEDLLRERGSTGNFAQDMVLGEALHKLSESAPEWYNRLYQAAENDKDVQEWKQESYKYAQESGEDQGRSIDDWWRESRFDQVVGGFILGGEGANVNTMREWNRDRLPYGTTFRKELEEFEDALGYRRGYAEGGEAREQAKNRSLMTDEFIMENQNKLPEDLRFTGKYGLLARLGYVGGPGNYDDAEVRSYSMPAPQRPNVRGFYYNKNNPDLSKEDLVTAEGRRWMPTDVEFIQQEPIDNRGVNIYSNKNDPSYEYQDIALWHELTHRGFSSPAFKDFASSYRKPWYEDPFSSEGRLERSLRSNNGVDEHRYLTAIHNINENVNVSPEDFRVAEEFEFLLREFNDWLTEDKAKEYNIQRQLEGVGYYGQ